MTQAIRHHISAFENVETCFYRYNTAEHSWLRYLTLDVFHRALNAFLHLFSYSEWDRSVTFLEEQGISAERVDEWYQLYTGKLTLEQFCQDMPVINLDPKRSLREQTLDAPSFKERLSAICDLMRKLGTLPNVLKIPEASDYGGKLFRREDNAIRDFVNHAILNEELPSIDEIAIRERFEIPPTFPIECTQLKDQLCWIIALYNVFVFDGVAALSTAFGNGASINSAASEYAMLVKDNPMEVYFRLHDDGEFYTALLKDLDVDAASTDLVNKCQILLNVSDLQIKEALANQIANHIKGIFKNTQSAFHEVLTQNRDTKRLWSNDDVKALLKEKAGVGFIPEAQKLRAAYDTRFNVYVEAIHAAYQGYFETNVTAAINAIVHGDDYSAVFEAMEKIERKPLDAALIVLRKQGFQIDQNHTAFIDTTAFGHKFSSARRELWLQLETFKEQSNHWDLLLSVPSKETIKSRMRESVSSTLFDSDPMVQRYVSVIHHLLTRAYRNKFAAPREPTQYHTEQRHAPQVQPRPRYKEKKKDDLTRWGSIGGTSTELTSDDAAQQTTSALDALKRDN